jgi:hypothetical protein
MVLLLSVQTLHDVPVRLYASKEAALADRENWPKASMAGLRASHFIGFRLVAFHDGLPEDTSDLFVEP